MTCVNQSLSCNDWVDSTHARLQETIYSHVRSTPLGSTQVPSTTTTCRQTTITTAKNVIPNFAGARALSGASFQSYRAGNADTIFNANNFCKCQIHAGSHPIVTAVPAISVVEIDKEIDEEELPPLID